MEAITSILKLVTPNMYLTKIDLKDAYYTIPMLEHKFTNLPAYLMITVMDHGNS